MICMSPLYLCIRFIIQYARVIAHDATRCIIYSLLEQQSANNRIPSQIPIRVIVSLQIFHIPHAHTIYINSPCSSPTLTSPPRRSTFHSHLHFAWHNLSETLSGKITFNQDDNTQ